MTKQEIEEEIKKLENQLKQINYEEYKAQYEENKKNIGKCFASGDRYVKIVEVPEICSTLCGDFSFDEYQYNAIYIDMRTIDTTKGRFRYYSEQNFGEPGSSKKYYSITNEEFNKVLSDFTIKLNNSLKQGDNN